MEHVTFASEILVNQTVATDFDIKIYFDVDLCSNFTCPFLNKSDRRAAD
jgi:hypothetical protein